MKDNKQIWNVCLKSTGVCVRQVASCEKPEELPGYVVRLAVSRAKRTGDYSDRAIQRAESGYAE